MEWVVRILEKGRITLPKDLRDSLGLKKGESIRLSLERGEIRLVIPRLEEDAVEKTKGILKGIEPELTPEELEEAFLTAIASKIKAEDEV